jgi:hypothetical protein
MGPLRQSARYPLIRRVRVWPLSLSVAAAAPFAPAPALVSMARMSLWVFTIDDLFDEETVPFPELRRRVDRYKQILAGENADPKHERDNLTVALQDIRDDLQRYELFPALQHEWDSAVIGTLEAMIREHDWRTVYRGNGNGTGSRLPSYETYLNDSLYSIGGPPHMWTALIATGDESVLEHLPRLKEMERTASICIRLANDLQSHHKELSEGKINSIVIHQQEAMERGFPKDIALELACETVRENIRQGLVHCSELQEQARTRTGYPEMAIADIARFVCDFYNHHDYHTFTAGRI